jgi:hypothetical protein
VPTAVPTAPNSTTGTHAAAGPLLLLCCCCCWWWWWWLGLLTDVALRAAPVHEPNPQQLRARGGLAGPPIEPLCMQLPRHGDSITTVQWAGLQFSVAEVEVVVARVCMEAVRSYRASVISRSKQVGARAGGAGERAISLLARRRHGGVHSSCPPFPSPPLAPHTSQPRNHPLVPSQPAACGLDPSASLTPPPPPAHVCLCARTQAAHATPVPRVQLPHFALGAFSTAAPSTPIQPRLHEVTGQARPLSRCACNCLGTATQ